MVPYYVDSTEDATAPSRRRREKTASIHRIVYAQPSSVAGQSATANYRSRPPQRRATNESEVLLMSATEQYRRLRRQKPEPINQEESDTSPQIEPAGQQQSSLLLEQQQKASFHSFAVPITIGASACSVAAFSFYYLYVC
mmetsp:Transcript_19404/g.27652  ORF Transcript_19404/g.27652 Transcript_19404/m.27652 type:complete len:140 (+) Transcript_19404:78-497(+)